MTTDSPPTTTGQPPTAARARRARTLAWLIFALIVGTDIACIPLAVQTPDNGPALMALVLCETLIPPAVGALIVRRQPSNPIGWLLLAHGVVIGPMFAGDGLAEYSVVHHHHIPGMGLETQISQATWPFLYLFIMLVAYLFPTGHFLSRRWRRFVVVCLAGYAVFMVAATFDVDHFDGALAPLHPPLPKLPAWLVKPPGLAGLLLIAASLVGAVVCARARLKRATGVERIQMLWFTWASLSVPAGLALCWLDYFAFNGDGVVTIIGVIITGSVLPIAIGIAILRHQLFDIEVVLSRTLTYGALTVLVVGVYAAVLLGFGSLVDNRSAAGLGAVAIVAVAIQPVHARLRSRVEHWVFGDRSDPYAALRRLSDRLEAAADPTQALAIVTSSVAEALRVQRVTVQLAGVAETATDGADVRVPLAHHDTHLGDLVVEVPRGRQLTVADRRLLDDLARQAAVVVNAIHLTLDLQRSRARLVMSREEERRRLRRDLHDGVGPMLAAMVLKLNVLGNTLTDPSSTELLTELREETKAAIGEIRRLVDDLRPPALDEVGLLSALQQKATSLSGHGGDQPLVIDVEGPDVLPPLPAAAEVAAYRIAMEAITNVIRHSAGSRCVVAVETTASTLTLTVSDNGRGPGRDVGSGVGLTSMRERAAELGGVCTIDPRPDGGTIVRAVIPLPAARVDEVTVPEQVQPA